MLHYNNHWYMLEYGTFVSSKGRTLDNDLVGPWYVSIQIHTKNSIQCVAGTTQQSWYTKLAQIMDLAYIWYGGRWGNYLQHCNERKPFVIS